MPLVMLALWSAVARDAPVGAWTSQGFTAYYIVSLLVRLLTGSWVVWQMTMEIRQGALAMRLLRPLHPLVAYSAENLAAMPLRAAVSLPIMVVLLFTNGRAELTRDPLLLVAFPLSVVLSWLLWFLFQAIIGALALLVHSAVSIMEIWFGFFSVFSGYLVPLDLFPPWARTLADWLPFHLMLSFPVRTLLGRVTHGEVSALLSLQLAYVIALLVILRVTWRAGLRRYAAFGG